MSVGFDQTVEGVGPWSSRMAEARSASARSAGRPPAAGVDTEGGDRARLVDLIQRMGSADEGALATFYDLTIGRLHAVVLRLTRNAPLAEEVVEDTYYQAWRRAGEYSPERAGPLTWLVMIGRSRALDALRARDPAILHDSPEDLLAEADLAHDCDPLDLLATLESNQSVHAAVARLAPAQRQMIGLAFFRGLSHQEIAAETGMPLGTVKSQIRRALATMRGYLEGGETMENEQ